jgi:cyclopropane fatty-acyl-phospholipid synthase-like methyltransferase
MHGSRKAHGGSKSQMMAGYFSAAIHSKAFEKLQDCNIGWQSTILDIGAGTGAFAERLVANGYTNVEAIEAFRDVIPGIHQHRVDLNAADWGIHSKYDVLVAIEIIEHVRSPYHFLEQCRRLCHPQTLMIVTTPNPLVFEDRLRLMISGDIRMMRDHQDHRTPLFPRYMQKLCREVGFRIADRQWDMDTLAVPSATLKGYVLKRLARCARWAITKDAYAFGSSNVWLLHPDAPDPHVPS